MASIVVTLPNGEKLSGKLAYQDEFHIGMRDSKWLVSFVAGKRREVQPSTRRLTRTQHCCAKYTDDDIHNLMAYLQTLR